MRHFTVDRWVDFARGLAEPEERARMREHLAAGCGQCQRDASFWTEVSQMCQPLEAQVVPEPLTRLARGVFPVRVVEMPAREVRLPVKLIWDSFLVPATPGLRATRQVGWQGLYHAGEYSVDLRIEPELRFTRATVIGQIANRELTKAGLGNIPVSLRAGKRVVAETESNGCGKFQLEYEQQARLRLCIYLRCGSKSIQIPLKRVTGEKPGRIHRAHAARHASGCALPNAS